MRLLGEALAVWAATHDRGQPPLTPLSAGAPSDHDELTGNL